MSNDLLNVIDETGNPNQVRGIKGAAQMLLPPRLRDVTGRMKVTLHQNIYEADFEYGLQPLRWEGYTVGGGTITSQPGTGGVRMRIVSAGDVTIRQSRPYHRYQPGKTMYMATATNLGTATANQRQRVGFFDDGNGFFFEQADPTATNPFGMFCTYRTDVNGVPVDTRISIEQWTDPDNIRGTLNWSNLQMLWMEYAWYGAGSLRWGVIVNGEPYILHQIGFGNNNILNQQYPWARTGNLPVRYEQRNLPAFSGSQNDFFHYGVSVCVEGRIDEQRGFTYAPGMAAGTPRRSVAASTTRYPLLSFRYRAMGTQEYTQASSAVTSGTTTSVTVAGTPWTTNQWAGRYVFFPGLGVSGNGVMARITSNTSNALTFVDNVKGGAVTVAPAAAQAYTIGLVNRGQLLPRTLMLSCDQAVTLELISSTTGSPVVLTGATFNSLASLGSSQSFSERDVSATAVTGGEVVYNAPAPPGALQAYDLSNFFALYNNIQGNQPDILTIAITTGPVAANVGCSVVIQEAMS